MISGDYWVWQYRGGLYISFTKPKYVDWNRLPTFESNDDICLCNDRDWMPIILRIFGLSEKPPEGYAWHIFYQGNIDTHKAEEIKGELNG